ncbi:efflux transporter outer membrane subunit [Lichenicola cladoniae]|nr:efflux transporter outer membrane subunit [Lichenicola cladoniae]
MIPSRILPISAALLLAGCAGMSHSLPQVAQLKGGALGLDSRSVSIDAKWWTEFGDPQLDRLVEAGLAGNPTLDSALARVRSAEAAVSVQHAGQLPQVSADGQVLDERFSERYIIPPPYGGTTQWVPTAQVNFSWDIDLFGRQRALLAQARSQADAARLDTAAARLTISTSVAQAYVGLAQAYEQVRVAESFVSTRQRALAYTEAQFHSQLASQFDLSTAETLLAVAQRAGVLARTQRDVLVHALARLVGRGADFYASVTPPTLSLDRPPPVPDLLPADLLGRRPDLLAGQDRIDAALSGRRVARADFLPDINLQGLVGLSALGLGPFFGPAAATFGGGGAIHVPIFEGGKLRARYRGATADLDQAVADYNSSVLDAVRGTADALTQVRSADADLAQQDQVVAGLRDTVRLNQVRITTGLGSRLDAIDSGFRLLEAEQTLVDLQANTLTRRVQLIAALGGGFRPPRATAPAHAAQQHS